MSDLTSCEKNTALISFDAAEKKAPVLNYNLPTSTTYTVQLFIPVEIPYEYWNEEAKILPNDSPYVYIKPGQAGGSDSQSISPRADLTAKLKDSLTKYWAVGTYKPVQPDDPLRVEKAQEVESMVKQLGTSHPMLSILTELPIAEDLIKGTISDQAPAKQQMTLISLKEPSTSSYSARKQPLYNHITLIDGLAEGNAPVWSKTFYGRLFLKKMISPIKKANPQLFVIEELEIASYLGNYGAGKTVKTFSLLPGEKTTISIKTWKNEKTEQDITQNILDSYSEDSANSFEKQLEDEFSTSVQTQSDATDSFSAANSDSETTTKSGNVGGSFKVGFGSLSIGGGGGYSTTKTTTSGDTNSTQSTASVSRSNAANSLQKGLDKHANQSTAARKHDVNIETKGSKSGDQGQEETITRELENINHSRVLNFVFRALDQEYLTIVYLKDVSFGFTKGLPGDGVATKLENLDNFLSCHLKTDRDPKKNPVAVVRNRILENLLAVFDFNGNSQQFIEQRYEEMPDLDSSGKTETKKYQYWHKKPIYTGSPAALNAAEAEGKLEQYGIEWEGKRVNGIILSVAKRILPTDALIIDALLGQGEALDCYNMRLQKAAADKADLENDRSQIALNILKDDGELLDAKAKAFAYMFNPRKDHEHE